MIDQDAQFMAILTAVGEAKQANANALGVPWIISQMGVGDANGTDPVPSRTQTSLINERRRAPLNQLKIDPDNSAILIAEQVIPEQIGGFWIREIGLYDEDNDLVAVANCPPTFKPELSQGSGRTQVVRLNILVSSTQNIQLKIDPSVVLATRSYVDDLTERASKEEAEKGTENSKLMTPLRVAQALAAQLKDATQDQKGLVRLATQEEVEAGENDSAAVTPDVLVSFVESKIEQGLGKLVPAGTVVAFAGQIAPSGYLLCNGAELSRTAYADLFSVIGTIWGAGDGSVTFNLPDARGEFIRGLDGGRGVDNFRTLGSNQKGSLAAYDHAEPGVASLASLAPDSTNHLGYDSAVGGDYGGALVRVAGSHITHDFPGGAEAYCGIMRPRNVVMNYIIKY